MRVLLSVSLLFVACGGASEPTSAGQEPSADTPTVSKVPAKPDGRASKTKAKAEPPDLPTGPLPPGKAVADFPTVAIVGHGIRFEVNPPFQAARMPGLFDSDSPDLLIVSWWDVGHEAAGRNGRAGLYNVGVVPGDLLPGTPAIRALSEQGKNGEEHLLQVGETGTSIRLPASHSALGGMGTVSIGPAEPEWKVQVGDAEPVAFPDKHFLHSSDPGSGEAILFDPTPRKPFGAWPAPDPPAPEPASTP